MTDATKVPERKLRHQQARRADRAYVLLPAERERNAQSIPVDDLTSRIKMPKRPWPFKATDITPLQWWRTLPPDAFRDAEQLLLRTTIEQIGLLHGGADLAAALAGDTAAAIDGALSLMPIAEITLTIDIAMTALCRCALAPNATAALVVAQIVGLPALDHGHAIDLASSWSAYGRRYASDRHKFRQAEAVLLSAFRERQRDGDSA
jgi:hypothetical protein